MTTTPESQATPAAEFLSKEECHRYLAELFGEVFCQTGELNIDLQRKTRAISDSYKSLHFQLTAAKQENERLRAAIQIADDGYSNIEKWNESLKGDGSSLCLNMDEVARIRKALASVSDSQSTDENI